MNNEFKLNELLSFIDSKRILMSLTYKDLSRKTGIELTRLRRILKGTYPLTLEEYVKLCYALEIRPSRGMLVFAEGCE